MLRATSLTSYISRIRRRESGEPSAHSETGVQNESREGVRNPASSQDCADAVSHDPLAPAIAVLRQRRFDIRQLHGDGDPTNKNLI